MKDSCANAQGSFLVGPSSLRIRAARFVRNRQECIRRSERLTCMPRMLALQRCGDGFHQLGVAGASTHQVAQGDIVWPK